MKSYINFSYSKKYESLPFLAIIFAFMGIFFSAKIETYIGLFGLGMFPVFYYISVREYEKFDYERHEKGLKGDICLPIVIESITKGRQYTFLYSSITIDSKVYPIADRYRNWDPIAKIRVGDTIFLKYFSNNPNIF